MIRNLKALGLALVASLAMSALAASAARAESADFAASKYPVLGEAVGDGTVTAASSIGTVTCLEVGGSSPVDGTGTLEKESAELETATVMGVTNCHATVLKLPITVDMNGCYFQAKAGVMIGAGTAEGSAVLKCPKEKEVTSTIFATKTKHTEGVPGCVTHVPEQAPSSGSITYQNITTEGGQKEVTVIGTNLVLHSTRTAGTLCTAAEASITYNGAFIVRGAEGVNVEITGTK